MHYLKPVGLEKGMYITASQVVARAGVVLHLSSIRVGMMFKELGFSYVQTLQGRFWVVVERSVEEMNSILPEEGKLENG